MAYADFQTLVDNLVRDDEAKVSVAQRDGAIDLAVVRYSTDRPQMKVVDVAAAGGNALALPGTWEAGFSQLMAVEYPIGDNPPSWLDRETYRLYTKTDGTQEIRFDDALPVAQMRLSFTIKQALVAAPAADTVPIADREAVCAYAASLLCHQLAALYSNTQDSTIQADAVRYDSKARERRSQAAAYRKQYLDHLGVDEKNSTPASASATVQLKSSDGGARLYHGRRRLH